MASRPDICAARDAIHSNPAGALAPLPVVLPATPMPSLPTPVPSGRCAWALGGAFHMWLGRQNSRDRWLREHVVFLALGPTPMHCHGPREVSLEEQRLVLLKRRGSTVGRRSILKSFNPAADLGPAARSLNAVAVEGVDEIR